MDGSDGEDGGAGSTVNGAEGRGRDGRTAGSVLSGLFAPERVAVVGATVREGSVCRAVTTSLQASFEGEIVRSTRRRTRRSDSRRWTASGRPTAR
ncbi:hypothetical protein BRC89_12480 [Halobacteriales archaeon QS_4_70_19]|nr:MAG: hypothetical protein BRC89_12480 [Halobacteriales archaeon QS_4_70_19]